MAWPTKPDVRTESVVFDGYTYNRYPDSLRPALRKYFQRAGGYSLHRAVWEFNNGPIPNEWHIHHKDGNPDNNDISNLECISPEEHYARHAEERRARSTTPEHLERLARIRDKASEWHRSEEGRAWHRENTAKHLERGGAAFAARKQKLKERAENPVTCVCKECGAEFPSASGKAELCGNACASRAHRRRKREKASLQP